MNLSDTLLSNQDKIDLSVVLPCLNEEETLAVCIAKIKESFDQLSIRGEIIIADNGSTDGSVHIANTLGARVVHERRRGYGSALTSGIISANSNLIIMADADDSYDLLEIPLFYEKLKEGWDFVQGCRFSRGGGCIMPGAMPMTHRFIGNPFFSYIGRSWFKAPVNDIYCGYRGFRKDVFQKLDLRCLGMEYAVEMIVKASSADISIVEVPVTLHPDGRIKSSPHLRTIRDGWRTLRFLLMVSPEKLFFIPGLFLILFGIIGYFVSYPGYTVWGVTFDVHTLLFSSLAIICGVQSLLFGILAKSFALSEQLLPVHKFSDVFISNFRLELGVLFGGGLLLLGVILLLYAIYTWYSVSFGALDYGSTMRIVIPGAMCTALGFQTIHASFLFSIFKVQRA